MVARFGKVIRVRLMLWSLLYWGEPKKSLGALLKPVMRQLERDMGLETLKSRRDKAKLK